MTDAKQESFYLERIRLDDGKFKNFEVPFKRKINVIIGHPASGKTRLLERINLIVDLSYSHFLKKRKRLLNKSEGTFSIEADFNIDSKHIRSFYKKENGKEKKSLFIMDSDKYRPIKTSYIVKYFAFAYEEPNFYFANSKEVICSILKKCLASFKIFDSFDISYNDKIGNFYVYKGDTIYFFEDLNDGYRKILQIFLGILSQIEIYAEKEEKIDEKYYLNANGIVIIDDIETFLHPILQQKILHVMADIFPNIQVIVSTNSPFIINSVRSECIIKVKDYDVCHIGYETYGMTINHITNFVMETNERPIEIANLFADFYDKISENDLIGARNCVDQLYEIGLYNDPDIARLNVILRVEDIKAEKRKLSESYLETEKLIKEMECSEYSHTKTCENIIKKLKKLLAYERHMKEGD